MRADVGTGARTQQQSRNNVNLSSPSPWDKPSNNEHAWVGLSAKCRSLGETRPCGVLI